MRAYRSLLVSAAVAVGAMGLVGCQSVQESNERAEMAAYAARQEAPATMPSDMAGNTVNVGAMLAGHNSLLLQNYTNTTFTNFDVWLNGAFVRHVSSLGARSSLDLDLTQFYDKSGRTIVQSGAPVTSVSIKNNEMSAKLLGPVSNG